MGKELRFDDKVVIVTGAGGGLGRAYARMFAARGAKVVINDLGGGIKGEGQSSAAADQVVDEIKAAGGEATPNYDSVELGDRIVKTALEAYGRVDVLINNAGILRDVSFAKMSEEDWNLIYKVHVHGAFKCTRAAWPIMREQGYGRVIMTASAAGIYGNFGQANYSMAKMGLIGFANTLAIEGLRRNILVNTIAPIAGSRLTETVLPPNLIEVLKPEYVAPLVLRLCHDSSEETGGLFEVGGGFHSKLRWERSEGKTFRTGREITPETVDGVFAEIASFAQSTHPADITASMEPLMTNLEAGPSKGGNRFIDVDLALGYELDVARSHYDERDVALYALGVGAAANPLASDQLQLVYEMHGGGMKVLPTFGVIPAINTMLSQARAGKTVPGLNYGLDRLLHGEQYTEVRRPLPTKARLTHKGRIKDIFDKGKHALVVTEVISYDEDGEELVRNEVTSLIRGAGGWGGDRGPSADVNPPPPRAPDHRVEEKIADNQALLYRLSGDWNPLHADPGFAQAFGFDRPILHGLCSFGYAARHVLGKLAPNGDPGYFKSIRVRFADSVFPGETLITEMWKESPTRIIFQTKVKERDSVVISNAAIELYEKIPVKRVEPKPAKAEPSAAVTPISADILNAVGVFIAENPDLVAKVKTTFLIRLSNPESTWTIDLKNGAGSVNPTASEAACTLEMGDADFMAMATGKADAMKLFGSGKLKISGDVMASQKLSFLKKLKPETVKAQMEARVGAGGGTAAAAPAEPPHTSWDVFIAIRDHIGRHPELVDKVGTVYLFKLASPDSAWTMDLKTAPGSVSEGDSGAAECTLEIAESDFMDMTAGKANPIKLFTTGKLKIAGNVMASQKLDFLQKIDPERAKAAVAAARAAGEAPTTSDAAPAPAREAQAGALFARLGERLRAEPRLAEELGAAVRFVVKEPDAVFTVQGTTVSEGDAGEVEATFTLSDADLAALLSGDAGPQELFQFGKLRVDGDIRIARRLGALKV